MQTTARLSVAEVFALLISVAAMRAAQNLPFSDLADAGLAKIEKSLPSDKVRDLRRFLDCLHIGQLSPKQDLSDLSSIDPALLSAFETAFLQQRCLRLNTATQKGTELPARSNRKPCSFYSPYGIWSVGIRLKMIFDISAWTGSANQKASMMRRSGNGMCHSRTMFVHIANCLSDLTFAAPAYVAKNHRFELVASSIRIKHVRPIQRRKS
jgi:hypothetical protein